MSLSPLHGHNSHQVVVGQRLLVPAFALHLGLQLHQLVVAHLDIARPDVSRVHEVGWLAYHGAVNAPPPPLWRLLGDAAGEPLAPHVPGHSRRVDRH